MSAAILKKWVCSSFSCCAKLVVASSSTYKVFWTFKKTLPSSAYLCVKNKKNVGKSYVYIYLHLSRSKVHRTQWGEFHFDVAFKVMYPNYTRQNLMYLLSGSNEIPWKNSKSLFLFIPIDSFIQKQLLVKLWSYFQNWKQILLPFNFMV